MSATGWGPFSLWDRGTLRSDLGQSQPGNSSLSPGACRAEARPPNWPYGRLDRSPLSRPLNTSVDAPKRGAKVCFAGGGRTDRWPQIAAIPRPLVLQGLRIVVNWMSRFNLGNPGLPGSWLGSVGSQAPASRTTAGGHQKPSGGNRERLAGGAGGGNERPCSPARGRRNPARMALGSSDTSSSKGAPRAITSHAAQTT